MHSVGPTLADVWSDFFFFISWQQIIKLIRNKSFFLWYSFTFNVVITHEIITFQDICIDKIPKYFTSIKDTYYAALIKVGFVEHFFFSNICEQESFLISSEWSELETKGRNNLGEQSEQKILKNKTCVCETQMPP